MSTTSETTIQVKAGNLYLNDSEPSGTFSAIRAIAGQLRDCHSRKRTTNLLPFEKGTATQVLLCKYERQLINIGWYCYQAPKHTKGIKNTMVERASNRNPQTKALKIALVLKSSIGTVPEWLGGQGPAQSRPYIHYHNQQQYSSTGERLHRSMQYI